MDKVTEDVIRAEANALAKRHRITDVERLVRILRKTARVHINKSKQHHDRQVNFFPSLNSALTRISPDKALDMFEKEDMGELATKIAFYGNWRATTLPLHTRTEFRRLIIEFVKYLRVNAGSLLSTGYPASCFGGSQWLFELLARLYPVKLPRRITDSKGTYDNILAVILRGRRDPAVASAAKCARKNAKGGMLYKYQWSREQVSRIGASKCWTECQYDQAPTIVSLSARDVERVEEMRPLVLNMKIRLLEVAKDYLASTDIGSNRGALLWRECASVIAGRLTKDSYDLLNTMDALYETLGGKSASFWSSDYDSSTQQAVITDAPDRLGGGLKSIFEFIAFVEREIQSGRIRAFTAKMLRLMGPDIPEIYYDLANSSRRDSVDRLISEILTYQDEEAAFVDIFERRLKAFITTEFKSSLLVTPRIYDLAESMARLLERDYRVELPAARRLIRLTSNKTAIQPMDLPPDTKWEDITIRFIDGYSVRIECKGFRRTVDYIEMGFENRRKHAPTRQWGILERLSETQGEICSQDLAPGAFYRALPMQMSLLSKGLKTYFNINERPFLPYRRKEGGAAVRSYKAKFRLIPIR